MTLDDLEFVVLVAGKSTRNYPHSKGIPHKSLLPLGDKKIIDYILEGIVNTGARSASFIVSSECAINSFKECFKRESEVENSLKEKDAAIHQLLESTFLPKDFKVNYMVQNTPHGLAHAIGLAALQHKNKHLAVVLPDDIVVNNSQKCIFKRFTDKYLKDNKGGNFFLTRKVEDVSRWGIIENGYLNEKPKTSFSNEASTMMFILDKNVANVLASIAYRIENQELAPKSEIHYSFYLNEMIKEDYNNMKIKTYPLQQSDVFFDCGNIRGYEQALIYFLLEKSTFKKENAEFVKNTLTT